MSNRAVVMIIPSILPYLYKRDHLFHKTRLQMTKETIMQQ